AGRAAGLARAIVNAEMMLKIAKRAVGLRIVAQRGAAGGDRLLKRLADRRGEPLRRRPRAGMGQRAGGPQRREAGAMQRFANINIAEAGDERLVEQRSFQRRSPACEKICEQRAVERLAERLDAHAPEMPALLQ